MEQHPRSNFHVAASQFPCTDDYDSNISKAIEMVKTAAKEGCNLILLQELFSGLYFCQQESPDNFNLACYASTDTHLIKTFMDLAKEYKIIIPISFFEKYNHVYFNSIIVIDADGSIIGIPENGSKL